MTSASGSRPGVPGTGGQAEEEEAAEIGNPVLRASVARSLGGSNGGEASVRGASYDALSVSEDISGSVQLIVEGQIATSTNGSDRFSAVGQAQIIGADGATSDVIIGVGQPTVTD